MNTRDEVHLENRLTRHPWISSLKDFATSPPWEQIWNLSVNKYIFFVKYKSTNTHNKDTTSDYNAISQQVQMVKLQGRKPLLGCLVSRTRLQGSWKKEHKRGNHIFDLFAIVIDQSVNRANNCSLEWADAAIITAESQRAIEISPSWAPNLHFVAQRSPSFWGATLVRLFCQRMAPPVHFHRLDQKRAGR